MDGTSCWATEEQNPLQAQAGTVSVAPKQLRFDSSDGAEEWAVLPGDVAEISSWLLGFIRIKRRDGSSLMIFFFSPLIGLLSCLGFIPAYIVLGILKIPAMTALLACLVVGFVIFLQKGILPARNLYRQISRWAS